MSLLFTLQNEWIEAENYFNKNPQLNKLKKDGVNFRHSYIKIDHEIYKIDSHLGEGSFGKVKKGRNIHGQEVAIKIQGMNFEMIQNEEDILNELGCLIGSFDQHFKDAKPFRKNNYNFMTNRKHYTVMSFIKGDNLNDKLSENIFGRLTYVQKLIIALRICKTIQFLHSNHIIHCDIKPQNIKIEMKNDNIIVHLLDFGLSKILASGEQYCIEKMVAGTAGYIAPEIHSKRQYSFKSDIYALGKMFSKDLELSNNICKGMLVKNYDERDNLETVIGKLNAELIENQLKLLDEKEASSIMKKYELPRRNEPVLLFDISKPILTEFQELKFEEPRIDFDSKNRPKLFSV